VQNTLANTPCNYGVFAASEAEEMNDGRDLGASKTKEDGRMMESHNIGGRGSRKRFAKALVDAAAQKGRMKPQQPGAWNLLMSEPLNFQSPARFQAAVDCLAKLRFSDSKDMPIYTVWCIPHLRSCDAL
jgi:hypothetical protein